MSDYTGPGIYEILPVYAPNMGLNVWSGDKNPGNPIKLYPRDSNAPNMQFEIVAAGGTQGKPEKGDREYHLIAVNSGLYVTSNSNGKVTVELRSPKDSSIRWKIGYAGNGAYYINNIDGKKQLNVSGTGKETGTELLSYNLDSTSNTQFLLKSV